MKSFLRIAFKFCIPAIVYITIVSLLYLIFDPFKVLYSYSNYFENTQNGHISLNKDHVSTNTYINNSKTINYNAFIMGSSRTRFFQINDWKKHLPKDAVCYHFDAYNESLEHVNDKVNFLQKRGVHFKNILLILDHDMMAQDQAKTSHLFISSPLLLNNSNKFQFQAAFYKAFFAPKFLYTFIDFKLSARVKPYMKQNFLIDDIPFRYDVSTNEVSYQQFENLIKNKNYYTPQRLALFYKRDTSTQKIAPPYIFEKQKEIFNNIASIANQNQAQIKIIISPLYDQYKTNAHDLAYLKALFGAQNVVDFSGINEYTNNYTNYYETSHYRPHVAKQLMDSVYHQNSN